MDRVILTLSFIVASAYTSKAQKVGFALGISSSIDHHIREPLDPNNPTFKYDVGGILDYRYGLQLNYLFKNQLG